MTAINITAYTENSEQIEAVKAVIKAFKIDYKITNVEERESIYKPEFIEMIKQGEKDLAEGKGISMTMEELEKLYS
ncbi:MAG: 3-dehydroquinate dehydratase [Spirosomataceae bacterium]|jgi:3-dehydroquinate dehydratase